MDDDLRIRSEFGEVKFTGENIVLNALLRHLLGAYPLPPDYEIGIGLRKLQRRLDMHGIKVVEIKLAWK